MVDGIFKIPIPENEPVCQYLPGSVEKITGYTEKVRSSDLVEILAGKSYDHTNGYFIDPTILVTQDTQFVTMEEEIFGPVLTIYVYQTERFEETPELVDATSPYALTGAIFAKDRQAINLAKNKLQYAAGNFL